jgi:hypothetical protein
MSSGKVTTRAHRGPPAPRAFSCKTRLSGGVAVGAMMLMMDPGSSAPCAKHQRRRCSGRRPCPRRGSTCRVGQTKKADESIPAPKGRASWTPAFPPANSSFLGPRRGPMMAITDPRPAPLRGSPAVMGGRRRCPRCGSTCAREQAVAARSQTSPSRTPKGAHHDPAGLSPANRAFSGGRAREP